MKVVALVPIKTNNQRLKGKNTKRFSNSKPLIKYILSSLLNVSEISETFVFSSDEQIIKFLPPQVRFLLRDKAFDSDDTSMNVIIDNFISKVDADLYVLAHATSPFIKPDKISKSIYEIVHNNYDSAFSVMEMNSFLWFKPNQRFFDKENMEINVNSFNYFTNYQLNNISRTQDLNPIYMETSGFYIFKKSVFLDSKKRIGDFPYLCKVSKIESMDIDDLEDFEIADAIVSLYKI